MEETAVRPAAAPGAAEDEEEEEEDDDEDQDKEEKDKRENEDDDPHPRRCNFFATSAPGCLDPFPGTGFSS